MQINKALAASIVRVLRPLVRILLRNGVPYGTFSELAKMAYIEVAAKEFGIKERRQTKARISLLTGLTRKEVQRLIDQPGFMDVSNLERYNRSARVISGWLRDSRFHNAEGMPAALSFDEGENSFSNLVKLHGRDLTPRAMLDELLNVGAVEYDTDGHLSLATNAYIPRKDEATQLSILGTHVSDLIETIDFNMHVAEPQERLFQRRVMYNNLPAEVMPALRDLSRSKGQDLLEELNSWIAQHDRDAEVHIVQAIFTLHVSRSGDDKFLIFQNGFRHRGASRSGSVVSRSSQQVDNLATPLARPVDNRF